MQELIAYCILVILSALNPVFNLDHPIYHHISYHYQTKLNILANTVYCNVVMPKFPLVAFKMFDFSFLVFYFLHLFRQNSDF